jgi:hypothetical protein
MTLDQRIKANDLIAQGFTVQETPQGVTASRGNDHRLLLRDGSMRRATGAKR